ncbi:MAG: tRNA1(Val) (adenine(37)-N6)-methyltransferase [Desulfomonilaceae bacterium]
MSRDKSETVDGLFRNKVRVIQASKGYRVSEDAVILTWFAKPSKEEFILDAGTGCGVIAFGLAIKNRTVKVVGLEIQEGLVGRAQRGVILNDLVSNVFILRGDLREANLFFKPGIFDMVVSNPPYYKSGSGRVSLLSEKALSRHQIMMPLADLFEVSSNLLKSNGRFCLIYPANESSQLEKATMLSGLKMNRRLWIHTSEAAEPVLVCMEAIKSQCDKTLVEENLYLYHANGIRTPEAEAILAGEDLEELD